MCTATVPEYPRPGEKFVVGTDASDVGIGGVLSQIQDGRERVVTYFSETLSRAAKNCIVTRQEFLAVVDTRTLPQIPPWTRVSPAHRPLHPDLAT